jgi:hypothetical protein
MDTSVAECVNKGGTITNPRRPVCEVRTAQCESRPGWKVVERDAYREASQRLVACTWMGG